MESAWKLLRKDISFSRLSWSDRFASMGKNELDYFSIWFRELFEWFLVLVTELGAVLPMAMLGLAI